MRFLFFFFLLILTSCGVNGNGGRNFIISQSYVEEFPEKELDEED